MKSSVKLKSNLMKKLIIFILFISFTATQAQVQRNNQSTLTIEKIMQDPAKWIGTLPSEIQWSLNNKTIYFDWNPDQDTLSSIYAYDLKTGEINKVPDDKINKLPVSNGIYNSDESKMIYTRDGDLFLLDIKKDEEKRLTQLSGAVSRPQFYANDKKAAFWYDQNLFSIQLSDGYLKQLSKFTKVAKKDNPLSTGQAKWLEDQQMELFEVLQEREEMHQARENKIPKKQELEEIYIGRKTATQANISPSGGYIVYSLYNRNDGKSTSVTHHITKSGYTEDRNARSKVGAPQSTLEMGVFDTKNNKTVEIETSTIPGLKDLPAYLKDYPEAIPTDSSKIVNREFNLLGPIWHPTKDIALVVALSLDNKDRWILLLDPKDGSLDLLDRQRDEAWIGGPGINGWNYSTGDIGWMPEGNNVWFQSEASGYSHLYTINVDTKQKKQLTKGTFEVYSPSLSKDGKHFYFTANMVHPGVRHFYKIPIDGGKPIQLTTMEGNNEVSLSPDEKYLAIKYSSANQPWELYLQENKAGAKAEKITQSITKEFQEYTWRKPEYITFKAEDGETVYARLYQPEKPTSSNPAIIFVHGAGYLQNAHKWWSSYFREYMFHNFLVDNGYTVLDMDYRGSAGYGRDWRTGIYRHMGGKDLSDHVDGAKLLVEKYGIPADKIGIYGGSYGGFITLMAMFKHPDVFAAGAGLRSVTDWAHYNHGYTSNILNTPVSDSIAYRRSSPIYFADGFKGKLLMCHGMVDDNVQFQDIVRLSQRLIELGKENWELAVYPIEAHGFTEPSSWTDEYKRIFKLFEESLKK